MFGSLLSVFRSLAIISASLVFSRIVATKRGLLDPEFPARCAVERALMDTAALTLVDTAALALMHSAELARMDTVALALMHSAPLEQKTKKTFKTPGSPVSPSLSSRSRFSHRTASGRALRGRAPSAWQGVAHLGRARLYPRAVSVATGGRLAPLVGMGGGRETGGNDVSNLAPVSRRPTAPPRRQRPVRGAE